ncbi:aminotransferase class V-fold PLP-dependent enzyme [Streptomyces sp. NPDC096310]|uniref:aminotransferase class V-fold PLP-dependent enzyme n=1 Tax=Streptomyces sp. NPDC096310 TaxID=3366082 RepID=UPI00382828A4
MTAELDDYLASFAEPTGYLNFGSYGPPSRAVVETIGRLTAAASTGVPSAGLHAEDDNALAAVARLTGFDRGAVVLTPSTSFGLLQIAFGLPRGAVLVSSAEFPSNLYAWWRAQDAGLTTVRTLRAVPGDELAPVTPERVAASLTPDTVAVAVSAVDFRTGVRADLAGIRSAIGDRLLVVDGIQAFGVVDTDWTLADALVVGGQKWLRAGWGTGFVALSPRGLARLRPILGGWTGVERSAHYDGVPHEPFPGAQRFSTTNGSPFASGALATALAQLESVGVAAVQRRIESTASAFIGRLLAADLPVLSPLPSHERAGLVVVGIAHGNARSVHERLDAAGVTATVHGDDRIRFSMHATTTPAALDAALAVLAEPA